MIQQARGITGKVAQVLVFVVDLRFVGVWTKSTTDAKFWGFLMASYTDQFWQISAWMLLKKMINSLCKTVIDGRANAIVFVCVYLLELVILAWKVRWQANVCMWLWQEHMSCGLGARVYKTGRCGCGK